MKRALVTGAKGFIGSNIANYFSKFNYEIYGIGHGDLLVDECKALGLKYWIKSEITVNNLKEIGQTFDLIFHCGGSGSVAFSIEQPYQDFKKTVGGTLEVLEYIRLYNPKAILIYPSSPAVQGEHPNAPIKEDYVGRPCSPYGYHKKITEDLCRSYSEKYKINIKIIRFFSLYGNGLRKQLIWDACQKMKQDISEIEFWGSGRETRDFIHISDALRLLETVIDSDVQFLILNGASGIKYTIAETVALIKKIMPSSCNIQFNNITNTGNPSHYWADMTKLHKLNWQPEIKFEDGLKDYVLWMKNI